jgi:hypothetical protein
MAANILVAKAELAQSYMHQPQMARLVFVIPDRFMLSIYFCTLGR